MTKAIIGTGALLAAAVALAGCGGSGSASGTAGTTTAVASVTATTSTASGSGSFSASVHGFAAQLQTSVKAFDSGNLAAAASKGGSLLTNCSKTVNGKLAPHATTAAQQNAVKHMRAACSDMSKAIQAGSSGGMAKAKQLANDALRQAQTAARLSS